MYLISFIITLICFGMSDVFGVERNTITEHLQNIFKSGELQEVSVSRKNRQTASDGKTYNITYYFQTEPLPKHQ